MMTSKDVAKVFLAKGVYKSEGVYRFSRIAIFARLEVTDIISLRYSNDEILLSIIPSPFVSLRCFLGLSDVLLDMLFAASQVPESLQEYP